MLVSLRCVVIRRCRRDDACRRSAGPAVPPSLAPILPEPSLRLRPALLGAFALFFRRLRGDLRRAHAPRASTVPGSLSAACAVTRPVIACSHLEVIAGGEPFSGRSVLHRIERKA